MATALGAFGYLKFLVRFSTPPVRKKLSMAKLNIKQKLARAIGKHHFSRKHILQILIWPMVCLGVAGLLWGVVISKLNSDREFLEKHTLSQVAALSRAVAKCLSLPLLKMDELSRSLQFQWEHEREVVTLDELIQGDPFLRQGLNFVGIVDRHGQLVRASQSVKRLDFSDREYFRFHRTNPTRDLRIAP